MQKPPQINLTEATISWNKNQQPISATFDDVYFSQASGINESRFVFIQHNALPQRWALFSTSLSSVQHDATTNGQDFTIGETGFGTGLNFLVAATTWLKNTNTGTLHFISAEKYPLVKADLQQALALWPELSSDNDSINLTEPLLQQYPPAMTGIHRLKFANNRIILTLLYGDAATMFASLKGSSHPYFARAANPVIDAWFLDGFAPSKNPDMWTEELFQTIAELSHSNTTFSTFTAAGSVRRNLIAVGFRVEKVSGFGHKRNMLKGQMEQSTELVAQGKTNSGVNSCYQSRRSLDATRQRIMPLQSPKTAIVIGAGIAGCSTARALAERGISVVIIEKHSAAGQEASGNLQGILYPTLSAENSLLSHFGLMALLNASHYYRHFLHDSETNSITGRRCGIMVLPTSQHNHEFFSGIAQKYPRELVQLLAGDSFHKTVGLPLYNQFGLFFPQLGWINSPLVCTTLIDHPRIKLIHAEVNRIDHGAYTANTTASTRSKNDWQLLDKNNQTIATAPIVVIANAFDSLKFTQTNHLPLKQVRGQLTYLPATLKSSTLKVVLCGKGYIAPASDNIHTLGATYNVDIITTDTRLEDHQKNLEQLHGIDKNMYTAAMKTVQSNSNNAQSIHNNPTADPADTYTHNSADNLSGRVAFRCATPDYLPLAGPAPQLDSYLHDYQLLKKDARIHIPLPGTMWPGLYLNIGHGSRGLSSAPLCAELLASEICGEAPNMELKLRQAIHPARFIIRDLIHHRR